MNNLEQSENVEQEGPERFMEKTVAKLEAKDAKDPFISSEWVKTKKVGRGVLTAGVLVAIPVVVGYRILKSGFNFAKAAIEGKGSFKAGYDDGKNIFSIGTKNDKK